MKSVFRCRVLLCFAVSSACAGRICRPFYGLCLPVYFPLFYLFLISHTLVFLSHSRFSPLASSFTQQLCPKVTYTFLCSCLLSPPFPPLISSCHVVLSSHVDPSLEDSSSLPLMWTSPFKWPLPLKWLLLSYESSFLAPPLSTGLGASSRHIGKDGTAVLLLLELVSTEPVVFAEERYADRELVVCILYESDDVVVKCDLVLYGVTHAEFETYIYR